MCDTSLLNVQWMSVSKAQRKTDTETFDCLSPNTFCLCNNNELCLSVNDVFDSCVSSTQRSHIVNNNKQEPYKPSAFIHVTLISPSNPQARWQRWTLVCMDVKGLFFFKSVQCYTNHLLYWAPSENLNFP